MNAAEQETERAEALAAMCSFALAGEGPGVIGATLADLMSKFLSAHQIPDSPAEEYALRVELLAQWCETVWKLVAVNEGRHETKQ
jgi:hypothetical protein